MPVNCQVVIESCSGTFVVIDVVSLKQSIVLNLWEVSVDLHFSCVIIEVSVLCVYMSVDLPWVWSRAIRKCDI